MRTVSLRAGLILAAVLTVGACAAPADTSASLDRARGMVQEAAADASVDRYARAELESAQDAFAEAERSARRGLSPQVVDHWAYLAEQRAAIARESGRLRRTEAEIRAAEAERARIEAERVQISAFPQASGAADPSGASRGAAVVTLGDQAFLADGFSLDPRSETEIARIVDLLKQDPSRIARIDGHSDDMGDRGRSLAFAGRRAEVVRGELARRGIDPRRITVRAVGDSFPVASNETPLGRERNRRVEVFVLANDSRPSSAE
jgi:OOP family OmpA-OmpF porin